MAHKELAQACRQYIAARDVIRRSFPSLRTIEEIERLAETLASPVLVPTRTPRKRGLTAIVLKARRQVASKKRPGIVAAIKTVLGTQNMDVDTVFQGLKTRGWLPSGAADPRSFVGWVLASNKGAFVRPAGTSRGVYAVREV